MSATQVIETTYHKQTQRILEEVLGAVQVNTFQSDAPLCFFELDKRFYLRVKGKGVRLFMPELDLNHALEAAEALADKLNCGFRIERFPGSEGERVTRASFNKLPVTCGCDHGDCCYVLGDNLTAENVTKLIIEVLDELERGKKKNAGEL